MNRRRRHSCSWGSLIRQVWHSQPLQAGFAGICLLLCSWLIVNMVMLRSAAAGPVDAFFVLGGSVKREIYVAELMKQHPQTPVLISQGSPDPCIWLIFQRIQASTQQVWLEKCAESTFENFYFSLPILQQWRVHKVKLITSASHLPRAQWLAQILLGAHGIWVEPEIVPEQGVPGNRESLGKTGLDVTRSLIWAIVSQVYQPKCSKLIPLAAVNLQDWQHRGFQCEHQADLVQN